ncbi:Hydroxyacylglutathione hydrolase [Shewanella halifaxensis HAW-EB4]|uniref:Hydroxyacylglutathione hydrolase n=1 Tax=Shewanella halifaxensis (strain HAW-EB4) TaxID=458817 RepID=GLO2_SHEHH|nr:hydroxyacylglutathione hydrolase [Shewanella halifaxensis]B0TRL8.1 RecName: Full=Hydroxyacylglutathione hydrolase; AltName: Full=Glyoxalase II; Short=Glx II [Shewanella halifaxensis HAW-EB4]ABZ76436.1 Hydroxyacylglutathione hydrolase [Shewanella halifaxensis HAW-EB4]
MLQITPLPAFNDNYIWVFQSQQSSGVYVVDPGDGQVVTDYLTQTNLPLLGILITHHHHDHTGGIEQLLKLFGEDTPVYGPQVENIAGVNRPISTNGNITLENIGLNTTVIQVPGHTSGHICYLIEDALFCGDTLFSGGCGRLFEGTAEQMYQSLTQLSLLPDNTRVFCAHEYTLANLHFAKAVEANNPALIEYTVKAHALRAENKPTLPSSIALEKAINPFLRLDSLEIQKSLAVQFQQPIADPVQSFALLRQWKDNF